jgi:hypothetical protein
MSEPARSFKGGQQVGQAYVAALESYLQGLRDEGKGLPARGGKVSTSAIALAAGVDRQSLYKNCWRRLPRKWASPVSNAKTGS